VSAILSLYVVEHVAVVVDVVAVVVVAAVVVAAAVDEAEQSLGLLEHC